MSRPLRATGILGDRTVRRGQAPWRAVAHRGTLDEKRLAPAGGPRVPTEFPPPRDRDSSPPPRSLTRIAGSRTPGMCHLRPDRPASVAYATPLRGLPNGSQANPESRGSGTQAAKCSLSRAGPDVDWRVQAAAAVTNRRAPDGPSARSRRASGRQGRAPGYILSMIALASANGRPSNIPDRSAADQQGKTIRPPALRPVHRTTMAQHRCQVERLASAPRVASRWHARGETLPSRSGTVDRSDWSGREESNRANRPECPIGALVRAHRRRPLDSCDCRMRPHARTAPMGMTLDGVPSGARHPHAQRPHRPRRERAVLVFVDDISMLPASSDALLRLRAIALELYAADLPVTLVVAGAASLFSEVRAAHERCRRRRPRDAVRHRTHRLPWPGRQGAWRRRFHCRA